MIFAKLLSFGGIETLVWPGAAGRETSRKALRELKFFEVFLISLQQTGSRSCLIP
jgi:hypothetical protein